MPAGERSSDLQALRGARGVTGHRTTVRQTSRLAMHGDTVTDATVQCSTPVVAGLTSGQSHALRRKVEWRALSVWPADTSSHVATVPPAQFDDTPSRHISARSRPRLRRGGCDTTTVSRRSSPVSDGHTCQPTTRISTRVTPTLWTDHTRVSNRHYLLYSRYPSLFLVSAPASF